MTEHTFDPTRMMEEVTSTSSASDELRLVRLEQIARLDGARAFTHDGFTSTSSFLVARCGMGLGEANREVFLARSLEHLDYATKAVESGRLTVNQLEALAHARARHPDVFAADQAELTESVSGLDLRDTRRLLDYWCQAHCDFADVDPIEPSRVFLSETLHGRARLDGDLDAELHSLMSTALDSLIDELIATTPKQDLPRMSELRAEALAEILRRHLDSETVPRDHGNRPHVTVVAGWDVLAGHSRSGICELGDGTVIAPETAQRLACDAIACRLLTGPASEILDLGRSRRIVSPAQWRALRVRDRHCRFPHCRRPWSWTDAHHIQYWTRDGETNLDNLILLCKSHHVLVHEGGWRIQGNAAAPTFIRPDGTPLNNGPP